MARHDKGWFKHYRIPQDHWLWTDHSARFLWWNLLSMATWKPTKLPSTNGFEVINPGTIITSRSELAYIMGDSENVVRRCLNRFRNDQMVAIKATKAGSVIYLVNWDKYQNDEEETTNESTNEKSEKEPTDNQQTTNRQPVSEESKKVKREVLGDCDDVSAIALPDDAKKFLLPESEIPETHDEIPVDFSGEKSMPVSPTETHPESTQEPSPVSQGQSDQKSTDSNDSGIKIETPDSNKIKPSKKPRKRPDVTPEESAARSATRSAYIDAFESRYAAKPIIAAKENTQIKNLVASVGQQDAPYLVKFYLECSDEFLVNKCHPIGILAANPTEYIVRWKRGQTNRPSSRFSYGQKRPDARYVHQCLPEPDDGDPMLPWEREELEAKKSTEVVR